MTTPFLAMLNTPEIIALLVLALILFGAKKLPELARGLGHGIKEFRKATRDVTDELQNAIEGEPSPRPRMNPPTPRSDVPYGDLGGSGVENPEASKSANPTEADEAVAQTAVDKPVLPGPDTSGA